MVVLLMLSCHVLIYGLIDISETFPEQQSGYSDVMLIFMSFRNELVTKSIIVKGRYGNNNENQCIIGLILIGLNLIVKN